MMLTDEQMLKIATALKSRGTGKVCAACNHDEYILMANLVAIPVSNGEFIPAVGMLCQKCGLMRQHAILVLGLEELITPAKEELQ